MKRTIAFLLVLAVLCCLPVTAFAHSVPEEREDCSISLTVRYDGKDLSGGTLTAVRIGTVAENDGNYAFARVSDGTVIENTDSSAAAEALLKYYEENRNSFEFEEKTVKIQDGKAEFKDLPTGLYLIIQEEATEGFSKLKPFLIGVPYLENGTYQYQVSASVKSEPEREPEPTRPEPTTPEPTVPEDKLPQTGQLNWPVPILAMAGIVLFCLGWMYRRDEKKEN